MRWKVGVKNEVLGHWSTASLASGIVVLTTGSPYYRVFYVDSSSGVRQYDQGNGTVGPASHQFPFPAYAAGVGWRDVHTPLAAMATHEITYELVHPDHPDKILDEGWVEPVDLKDLQTLIQSVTGTGDIFELRSSPG